MALTDRALTTVDALAGDLGISSPDSDTTAVLERLIESASRAIEQYVGRTLYYEAGIEERAGVVGRTKTLLLERRPIVSITSIEWDPDGDGSGATTVPATSYRIGDAEAGEVIRDEGTWQRYALGAGVRPDPIRGSDIELYTVTYTGGWVTPQQAADDGSLTRELPYDIEQAALLVASSMYRARGRDRAVKSRKTLGASITYHGGGSGGMGPDARALLSSYRRVLL